VATTLLVADLVDTWTDSVCIHQLVLKPCSKAACIVGADLWHSNSRTVAHRIHSGQNTLASSLIL